MWPSLTNLPATPERIIKKQYEALAEIGEQLRGKVQSNSPLSRNMKTFMGKYCGTPIMAEAEGGEISDCGGLKEKVEKLLDLKGEQAENFNLNINDKLTELSIKYPMVSPKPDKTDDIIKMFKATDVYVREINAIFAKFKEQPTPAATTKRSSYKSVVQGQQQEQQKKQREQKAEKLKELQKEHKKHTARAPAGRRPGPRGPFSPEGRTGQTPRRSPTEPDYEWGRRRTKGRRPN